MAENAVNKPKSTALKKSVKVVKIFSKRIKDEFPRAELKNGKYLLPWKTEEALHNGWANYKPLFSLYKSEIPTEETLNAEPLLQLIEPDPKRIENPPDNGIRVTWLGHASALFQLDSVSFLVNPNFNPRGGKDYHFGENKRYRKPVYTVEQLPHIDCVFITNNHFDYLDLYSVEQLNDRFNEMLLWYVPMGVGNWMTKTGFVNVVEMDWWEEDEIEFYDHTILKNEQEVKSTFFYIACTPSQSYHNNDFDDDNAMLWCSWVIRSPRYKIFISGSTGYAKIFQSVGRKYGPFHMAALPIGGYDVETDYQYGYVTPEQAVQVHKDILSMCSLALSWGTFTFSSEHYLEPPRRLNEELKKTDLSKMQFLLLKHGESRLIEITESNKSYEPLAYPSDPWLLEISYVGLDEELHLTPKIEILHPFIEEPVPISYYTIIFPVEPSLYEEEKI